VSYGVVHDQITAYLCIEYFSVAHPPIFPVSSPALLALCWGVVSTSGVGLLFGMLLAKSACDGDAPQIAVSKLGKQIASLLGIMSACAAISGFGAYFMDARRLIPFSAAWVESIPADICERFLAVWATHMASYVVGFSGAGLIVWRAWNQRGRPKLIDLVPPSAGAWVRAAGAIVLLAVLLWIRFGRG
jgi:hypothetical protein